MKIFLPKITVIFLVLTDNFLNVHASECCTWNHIDCPSQWCSESAQNCGTCGGIWADLTLNPPGCCTWTQGECGDDVLCNSHPVSCEGQCNGQWVPAISSVEEPTASPVDSPTASPVTNPTSSPIVSPTQSHGGDGPNPIDSEEGELTMWTDSHPGPVQGGSCEYAQPDSTNGQPVGTVPSWLENYVEPKMYCAVSEDLFNNGVGCGKCYRLSYDGNSDKGTDTGRAGSAEIQVVDSGAGGQNHFDCFLDAHEKITGTNTGIFKITYDEIPCKESPLTAVILEANNPYYVKVLFAGGTTGLKAADITVGGIKYPMYKNSGATWAVNLPGSTQGGVQFDVTFTDGSVGALNDCFSSQWPVSNKGEQCASQ